jgi:hypothetical protein
MIEFLKTLGSFLGLITAVVFFYDRAAKGRPIGSITVKQGNGRKLVCIRISNPSDYDIAILGMEVIPRTYFLTEDMEVRSLVANQLGEGPYFLLKPREERELVIAPLFENNVALEMKPHDVKFKIYWRRGNATWLKQWPVHICTSTTTLRKYGLEKGQA